MGVDTAVIGAGVVSESHLSVDAANPRANLVAVCDIDEDRAEATANDYGITPYFDVEELLANEDLGLVHVCTSVQTHLPLARAAIEAGVPTVIEKPIAETVAEVEELRTLSEGHDIPVTVIHQGLFSPAMRTARRLIESGELGAIRAVELVKTGGSTPDEANRGDWVFDLPGGEFEEGLPHNIYPLLATGGYPRSEDGLCVNTGLAGEYAHDFAYDGAQVQYVSESGTFCSTTMTSGGQVEKSLHVQGTGGAVSVDIHTQVVTRSRGSYGGSLGKVKKNVDAGLDRLAGSAKNAIRVARQSIDGDWETRKAIDAHAYQLDGVVEAVETGGPMPVPVEEGRWTVALMEAIREESTAATRQPNLSSP